MANSVAAGRGGDVAFYAPGLIEFLREASQGSPEFNKELRIAAQQVADKVVKDAQMGAAMQAPHGKNTGPKSSGMSQAQMVSKGLRARRDRIPIIKLDHSRGYPSKSRPNRSRKQKVMMGHVFYGAEFGGRGRPTTRQFLRHRGKQGYFFWEAVRDNKSYVVEEYSKAIDMVFKKLASGAY
jgi:hypothetical protein